MGSLYHKLVVWGFLAIIFGFFILGLVTPDWLLSEEENRTLAQPPKLSAESVLSGKFSQNAEQYINDQFPLRSNWIMVKSAVEYMQGKKDSNGVYFAQDNYLLQKLESTLNDSSESNLTAQITKNAQGLESFLQNHPNYQATMCLIPTSTWVFQDKLPKYAEVFDEKAWADYTEGLLSNDGQVKFTTAFEALENHKTESIFYKTDHHYTSLGAYYVYEALGKDLGYNPLPQEAFGIETVSDDFYGTSYSKGIFAWYPQDRIEIFKSPALKAQLTYVDSGDTFDGLYDFSKLTTRDKYSMFLGGNYGYIKIKTNVSNGKTLNIVKDSFAHALVPFLANHYEEINVYDLRYYRLPFETFLAEGQDHEFLFLYNIASYLQEGTIFQIKYL